MENSMLQFHENVFDAEYCLKLFADSLQIFTSDKEVWSANYFWEGPLTADMFPWFIRSYDEETSKIILTKLREQGIIKDSDREYNVMNYIGTRLSYIPWHYDHVFAEGITIYLNDYWPEDWGGLFLYKNNIEDNVVHGYVPKFNTAVKNNQSIDGKGIWHHVSTVAITSKCPRSTIQIFPKERKNNFV
jgi:hypothetical protein